MLLNISILLFVIGLLILVFSRPLLSEEKGSWRDKKVRRLPFPSSASLLIVWYYG